MYLVILLTCVGADVEKTDLTAGDSGNTLAVAEKWSRYGYTRVKGVDPM